MLSSSAFHCAEGKPEYLTALAVRTNMPGSMWRELMSLAGKCALITGSSRGIGRGIAFKLAEQGAKIAVHYYQNEAAAKATLAKIRERGSDGFVVQGDVCHHEEVSRIFQQVESEFGKLDIFVHNARTEAPTFYQPAMQITLDKWDTAVNSLDNAFLAGVREAARL